VYATGGLADGGVVVTATDDGAMRVAVAEVGDLCGYVRFNPFQWGASDSVLAGPLKPQFPE